MDRDRHLDHHGGDLFHYCWAIDLKGMDYINPMYFTLTFRLGGNTFPASNGSEEKEQQTSNG